MNRSYLFGFCFLYLAAGVARSSDGPLESRYLPLKVGNEWVYKTASGSKVIQRVTRHEKMGDTMCAKIEVEVNGKSKGFEHIFVKKDGLYRKTAGGKKLDPPLCFLKCPVQIGNIWAVNSSLGEHKITGRFQIEEAEVTVPAGTYRAFIARSDNLQAGSQALPTKCWYVPDIGMVKQEVKVGEKTIVLVLEKFTEGTGKTIIKKVVKKKDNAKKK